MGDQSLEQLTTVRGLFKYQSGRVIALGRVMLGVMFLFAVLIDQNGRSFAWAAPYAPFTLYVAIACVIAAAMWRNWWLDARLAIVTHGVDMAVFTAIVFSANSSTSPFFLFFVLPLLSAAIRWSWRETALTATALVVLYLIAGMLIAQDQGFELERFVIRAGHLVTLSLLLIWFGIHQRRTRLFASDEAEAASTEHENPLARALGLTMHLTGAGGGALVVGPVGDDPTDGFLMADGQARSFIAEQPLVRAGAPGAMLFDLARDRILTRLPEGRFRFLGADDLLDVGEARRIGLGNGLVAEVRTGTQRGWLVLWDVPELSTDYIDLGRELGRVAGAVLDRHALLAAIETGTAARTRLSLARDVHDGIIQFLAGAAFRLEAIKRSARSGAAVVDELDELKRLLVDEQSEIRGFVTALRLNRQLELAETVDDLRALAERLGQQWSVECQLTAHGDEASIPIRLHLDLQQLLREAVANAVRHGAAKRIDVDLRVGGGRLDLSVTDDGTGFPADNGAATEPWSLKERTERAHGSLRLASAPGSTNILISLPLAGAAA